VGFANPRVPRPRWGRGVCAVYAQRTTGAFVEGAAKDDAEAACVETGLEALQILATMDRQKQDAGTDRWRPSLWN